jgi:hypothetical protein
MSIIVGSYIYFMPSLAVIAYLIDLQIKKKINRKSVMKGHKSSLNHQEITPPRLHQKKGT